MTLTEKEWETIYSPVLKTVKRMMNLPRSYPTAALFHDGITGLENPWNIICANQVADFVKRMNEKSVAARTTLLRLRQAQCGHLLLRSIFTLEREEVHSLLKKKKYNLSLHILLVATIMQI